MRLIGKGLIGKDSLKVEVQFCQRLLEKAF